MSTLASYRQLIEGDLEKLEVIKNQKIVQNIPIVDEIKAINNLSYEKLENKEFNRDLEILMKQLEGDYLPKIIIKNESNKIIIIISQYTSY